MAVDIADLFAGLQQRLVADLSSARASITHPGDKGGVSEDDWRTLLRTHLPERYSVAKATVIDSNGGASDSIDVVIYDRLYSYLLMERHGLIFVPAEAVYAVFEVKQIINKQYLNYAGDKAASVRSLVRTSVPITDIRGNTPAKQPIRILSGLLALTSEWTPMLGDAAKAVLEGQDALHLVDIGCALEAGAWEAVREEGGNLRIASCTPDSALLFTLLAVIRRLQSVGTVAPIDIAAYARWLK
jgi:hypothetical protein